jgi:protease I
MANRLVGKKVAFLLEEGYEDTQVTTLLNFLKEEGASVRFIGPNRGVYKSRFGASLSTDLAADEVQLLDFDAFVIPGGYSPEKLRLSPSVVNLIANADDNGKFIAAIGRGPQLLISAEIVKDRMLTCYIGIVVDLKNAGAYYVDEAVVRDGNIVTARGVDDLADFNEAIVDALEIATPYIKNVWAGA